MSPIGPERTLRSTYSESTFSIRPEAWSAARCWTGRNRSPASFKDSCWATRRRQRGSAFAWRCPTAPARRDTTWRAGVSRPSRLGRAGHGSDDIDEAHDGIGPDLPVLRHAGGPRRLCGESACRFFRCARRAIFGSRAVAQYAALLRPTAVGGNSHRKETRSILREALHHRLIDDLPGCPVVGRRADMPRRRDQVAV
jgi:hypothetical protein